MTAKNRPGSDRIYSYSDKTLAANPNPPEPPIREREREKKKKEKNIISLDLARLFT